MEICDESFVSPMASPVMNTRLTAHAVKSFFLAKHLESLSVTDLQLASWQSHSCCHSPSTLRVSSLNSESEHFFSGPLTLTQDGRSTLRLAQCGSQQF